MATVCTQSSFGINAITCHSFNKDETQVAISLNDEVICIYKDQGAGNWTKIAELREHTGKVTGIDWDPNMNKIVSCGADRNAYVWNLESNGIWKPTLVVLRINRGAITVKWSPKGDKFAVGSASRFVTICYFEETSNWWVAKHIKKPIRSSVLSLSWHPNNVLIAAGTSDFKCRIFSTYIKEIEGRPEATCWGRRMPFGQLMAEFGSTTGGWVHGVSFNSDGTQLAWVGHNSTVSIATGGEDPKSIETRTPFLPFTDCTWISEISIAAVGFDCNPIIFTLKNAQKGFEFDYKCDDGNGEQVSQLAGRAMFQAMDRMATNSAETVRTKHKNSILEVIPTGQGFSTAGADGQIVKWNKQSLADAFSHMNF